MPKVLKPLLKCGKWFYTLTCLFVFICMWKALAQRDTAMQQSVQIIKIGMYKQKFICALGLMLRYVLKKILIKNNIEKKNINAHWCLLDSFKSLQSNMNTYPGLKKAK